MSCSVNSHLNHSDDQITDIYKEEFIPDNQNDVEMEEKGGRDNLEEGVGSHPFSKH